MTRLRRLRVKKGLRILDLTLATRMHASQISAIKRGRLAVPARAKEALCTFFGVEPGKLFNGNGIAV
jgi:transcriptional regulator with XRE-family HTH domain